MKASQTGLTLIELIVVLAIIGILLTFAMPAYRSYTARSQILATYQLTSELRNELLLFYAERGSFPDMGELLTVGVANDIYEQGRSIENAYVARGNIHVQARGRIQITFTEGANRNTTMLLLPIRVQGATQLFKWRCQPDTRGQRIPDAHLPTACSAL